MLSVLPQPENSVEIARVQKIEIDYVLDVILRNFLLLKNYFSRITIYW